MKSWSRLAFMLALSGGGTPAMAASVGAQARVSAPLWREIAHPGRSRAHALLAQAGAQVREANRLLPSDWRSICTRTQDRVSGTESLLLLEARARALRDLARQAFRRQARLDSAEARLRRALALAPHDPDIMYALSRVLMASELPGPAWRCAVVRRDDEALVLLKQLNLEHPSFMPDTVALDLALLLTRKHLFVEAAQAYERALALGLDGAGNPVTLANLAEVTMLAGNLEGAIARYQQALASASGGRDYLLATWGMAVALDRLGEHDSAAALVSKAIAADGESMQVLRSDGVFFEPEHERDYYDALGHQAFAERAGSSPKRELEQAAASLSRFIEASGQQGQFTQVAETTLSRIHARLQRTPASRAMRNAGKPH
jgi:tetratricopeptide (TPR) repeat protein